MQRVLLFISILTGGVPGVDFFTLRAQTTDLPSRPPATRNAIVVGLSGNAPVFSLNYHRQLIHFRKADEQLIGFMDVSVGVGLEITEIPIFGGSMRFGPTLPHSVTVNFGQLRHFFELGYGGVVVASESLSARPYIYTPLVGWRYKSAKGFLFRLYFSAWVLGEDQSRVIFDQHQNAIGIEEHIVNRVRPRFGLSLGKAF